MQTRLGEAALSLLLADVYQLYVGSVGQRIASEIINADGLYKGRQLGKAEIPGVKIGVLAEQPVSQRAHEVPSILIGIFVDEFRDAFDDRLFVHAGF